MKFWTIRRAEEIRASQLDGVLRTHTSKTDSDFHPAYDWMRQQLEIYAGPPPAAVVYPIWVWKYWQGVARARPDLRTKCLLPRGTLGARLELDLPCEDVLLSHFDGWHAVLNNHYHALNDAEYEKFEKLIESKGINHPELIEMKKNSWRKIFDLSRLPDLSTESVQGVVWEVSFDKVKKIDYFIAR